MKTIIVPLAATIGGGIVGGVVGRMNNDISGSIYQRMKRSVTPAFNRAKEGVKRAGYEIKEKAHELKERISKSETDPIELVEDEGELIEAGQHTKPPIELHHINGELVEEKQRGEKESKNECRCVIS